MLFLHGSRFLCFSYTLLFDSFSFSLPLPLSPSVHVFSCVSSVVVVVAVVVESLTSQSFCHLIFSYKAIVMKTSANVTLCLAPLNETEVLSCVLGVWECHVCASLSLVEITLKAYSLFSPFTLKSNIYGSRLIPDERMGLCFWWLDVNFPLQPFRLHDRQFQQVFFPICSMQLQLANREKKREKKNILSYAHHVWTSIFIWSNARKL